MPELDVLVVGAGNTHYSGGLLRFAYERSEDLLPLVPDAEQHVPGFLAGVEPSPATRFHANYPAGAGLVSGAVFGRLAGAHAAGA